MVQLFNENVVIKEPNWIVEKTEEELLQNQGDINVLDTIHTTTMVFGIFYIDKYMIDTSDKLKYIYELLTKYLESWNFYFPWNMYFGINCKIVKLSDGLHYILGSLCVDDNSEIEGSILTGLLVRISKELGDDNVFMKILDTEGDFLMAQCHETVPDEYEYPIGTNRLWLNNGEFKVIPKQIYYPNRGLHFNEAVDFLERAYFRCIKVDGVTDKLEETYDSEQFHKYIRTNMSSIKVSLSNRKLINLLQSDPKIATSIIKNAYINKISALDNAEHSEVLEIPMTNTYCNILTLLLSPDSLSLAELPTNIGSIIEQSFEQMLENDDLNIDEMETDASSYIKVSPVFELQNLEEFRPNAKFLDDLENNDNTESVLNQLNKYFEKSVNDKDHDGKTEDLKEQEEDKDTKDYFKKEGLDVTEDDFFEFFLKNALKVKDQDLSSYRNSDDDMCDDEHSTGVKTDLPEELDDEEEMEEMEQIMEQIFKSSKNSAGSGLDDLISSLKIDGSLTGPLQSLLQNMSDELNE